jgi:fumarate reductase flavoprotein subunit
MNPDKISNPGTLHADVLVLGAGGTGLAASISAAEKGAKVILLEKKGAPGGNSAMAIGLLAAESPVQKRMCISAPKDEIFKLGMEYAHWRINPWIWRTIVNWSGDTIQWLEERGVKFNEVASMYPGQAIPTWHIPDGFGAGLVKALRKHSENLGVQLIVNSRVKRILTDNGGSVKGVMATSVDNEFEIKANSVIIATGGYGGNTELIKKYYPSYHENMKYTGFPHATGDGLLIAMEMGAATEGLGTLMVHPPVYREIHVNAAAIQPYTIWVNKNGERFTDEAITFHCVECGNALDKQPDKLIYSLLDEGIKKRITKEGILTLGLKETGAQAGSKLINLSRELQSESGKGELKISNSWDEIASWMGINGETLKSSVARYNHFCDRGYDEDFAKDRTYLQALQTPPYYAVRCYQSFLTTVGGIKINQRMEVLNQKDLPIKGLYAGGDSAGGWTGDTYCFVLSGSAFAFAINSGRIAGENAADFVRRKERP